MEVRTLIILNLNEINQIVLYKLQVDVLSTQDSGEEYWKRFIIHPFNIKTTISGVLSHKAVREKIVRAFLIEEQKLCNQLMRDQQGVGKKE